MERKLEEAMKLCDLDVFEAINSAIQMAKRLYPTELALRRDRIIEGLYNNNCSVREQDTATIADNKAKVATTGCVGTIQQSTAGQVLPQNKQGLINTKEREKIQFCDKRGICKRNKTPPKSILQAGPEQRTPEPTYIRQGCSLAAKGKGKEPFTDFAAASTEHFTFRNNQQASIDIKGKGKMQYSLRQGTSNCNKVLPEIILRSSADQTTPKPICTRQEQSSATKGKGKEPCTEFADRPVHFNSKNNQFSSYDMKRKNYLLSRENMKKDYHVRCKSLPIGGGKIGKKLNSSNRGLRGSHLGANNNLILAHFKPSKTDDKFNCEESEDPLDWWVNEETPKNHDSANSDGVDMDIDDAKLKGSDDSNNA